MRPGPFEGEPIMGEFAPSPFLIFVLAVVILAVFLILAGVKTVPQATQWTVERFGRYTRSLPPGLNLIVPVIDRIGVKVSMRETVLDIPPQDVITYDNATVKSDGVSETDLATSSPSMVRPFTLLLPAP